MCVDSGIDHEPDSDDVWELSQAPRIIPISGCLKAALSSKQA